MRDATKIRKNPISKEKIQTKQKALINEPIPLSNRPSPMDIEDPVETTIHIKTDTIKLQKRLNEKINTKDRKMKHKLQKVDIDQLQDQRKKKRIKKQFPPPRN